MAESKNLSIDWRVALGLVLTTVWITAGLIYLFSLVGLRQFVNLPTADIGSFLEGAFAPLAFLWLVIGHFMQQKEITANTQAIHFQRETAKQQELLAQRDNYFKLSALVQEQLGSIAGFHFMSVCGPTGSGEVTSDEFSEMRNKMSAGDNAWFVRKMIGLVAEHREDRAKLQEILFGTEVRQRHTDNFDSTFFKLLQAARKVDYDELLEGALLNGSAAGVFYRIIRCVKGDTSVEPIFGLAIDPDATMQLEAEESHDVVAIKAAP